MQYLASSSFFSTIDGILVALLIKIDSDGQYIMVVEFVAL